MEFKELSSLPQPKVIDETVRNPEWERALLDAANQVGLDLTEQSNLRWLQERMRFGFSSATIEVLRRILKEPEDTSQQP